VRRSRSDRAQRNESAGEGRGVNVWTERQRALCAEKREEDGAASFAAKGNDRLVRKRPRDGPPLAEYVTVLKDSLVGLRMQ